MTDSPTSRNKPAARPNAVKPARSGARRAAGGARPKAAAAEPTPKTPEDMLRAGLKAFRLDRFMGWMPPAGEKAAHGLALPGLDPFGLRKFEDVFDQRVASALRHLGWPGVETLPAMQAEIDALRAEVARLRKSSGKSPAPKPAAAGKASARARRTPKA